MIKTWEQRCEEHPDHQTGMVSHSMIQMRMQEEIDELRAALAQPDESFCDTHCTWHDHHPDCTIAQPERKPLTDDQIDAIVRKNVTITDQNLSGAVYMAMRELEAAHGIEEDAWL